MTIAMETRNLAEDALTRWFRLTQVEQRYRPGDNVPRTTWTGYAACGQGRATAPDPDLFFPVEADSAETYLAQRFCVRCPVREMCAGYGALNSSQGVWGGIFRDSRGRPAPLCEKPGCIQYRAPCQRRCRAHIVAEDREGARRERVKLQKRQARRAAAEARGREAVTT